MKFYAHMSDMLKKEIESPQVDIERSDFNNTLTAIRFLQASREVEFNTGIFLKQSLYCDNFKSYIYPEYKLNIITLCDTQYDRIAIPNDYVEIAKNACSFIKASNTVNYCKIYYSEKDDVTLIITRCTSIHVLDNKIASVLPKLLPYLGATRLKEREKVFFTCMANNELEGCLAEINKLVETMDLREYVYKQMFVGVASGYKKRVVAEKKRCYDTSCSEVDRKYDALMSALVTRENCRKEHEAAMRLEDGDDDDVRDFFKSYKNLSVEKVSGSAIYFTIEDSILYYDEELFERNLENGNSYLYCDDYGNENYDNNIRRLLIEIFLEHKYEIQTAAHFCLNDFASLEPQSRYLPTSFINEVLPHPHLYEYRCLGENGKPITEALMKGDWKLAVEQAIAAVRNLWFGDYTVMSTFMDRVTGRCYDVPFLKNTETGEMVSPSSVIAGYGDES